MALAVFPADTDERIAACHPVIAALRPHIETPADLVAQVRRQAEADGYFLVYVSEDDTADGRPVACAGCRWQEMLAHGRFLYIDDLVTLPEERSKGHGDRLIDWAVEAAAARGCRSVQLDSGTQRWDAHRFYFRKRMSITSYHFAVPIGQ